MVPPGRRKIEIDWHAAEFETAVRTAMRNGDAKRIAEFISAGYPRDDFQRKALSAFVRRATFKNPRGNPNFKKKQVEETTALRLAAAFVKHCMEIASAAKVKPEVRLEDLYDEVSEIFRHHYGYKFMTADRLKNFYRR